MERRAVRFGAIMLSLGTVLFGGATLLHPPTADPWDPTEALSEATRALWVVDHAILLTAVFAIHLGLFILHGHLVHTSRSALSYAAFACAVASLVLWISLFVFELTGWPLVAGAATSWFGSPSLPPAPGVTQPAGLLSLLARSAWATTIVLGYAAAVLLAVAVLLWSVDVVWSGSMSRRLGWIGVVAGAANVLASPLAVALPRIALWLLVPAAGLLGLWFLAAAWTMWRTGRQFGAIHEP